MIYGMYLSTMGAMVQSQRHATISNNLANSTTNGFKPDWSVFTEVPVENEFHPERNMFWDKILMNTGGGVWNDTTVTNITPGPMQETGNIFDLALADEPNSGMTSFFTVRPDRADASTYYTREGHFVPDQNGILRNMAGDMVLDPGGNAINVTAPLGATVSVNEFGAIIANSEEGGNLVLGQIGVMRTANYEDLVKVGDNLFFSDGAEWQNWQNGVMGGYLEMSATHAIEEMTNMIEASRIYETNMRFLSMQDEQLGNAIRRIAQRAT